jgi:SM-20-related protein
MIEQIVQDIQHQGFSLREEVISLNHLRHFSELFEREFAPAKIGHQESKQREQLIRGDYIHWIDPLNPPDLLKPEIAFLNQLKSALNQKFYLGIKEFECHLAKYPPGSFYKKHVDRFHNDSSRVISFIFYLHESWSTDDGGELVLYSKSDEVLKSIIPRPGSLVCFVSEDFPHEVKICSRERRSLTGWMHTKIIY